jgi:hypothetical protein
VEADAFALFSLQSRISKGAEYLPGAKIITGLLAQAGVLNLRVWPSERRFSGSMLLKNLMIHRRFIFVLGTIKFYRNLDATISNKYGPNLTKGLGNLLKGPSMAVWSSFLFPRLLLKITATRRYKI